MPYEYTNSFRDYQLPMIAFIEEELAKEGIDYKTIRFMDSSEIPQDLEGILTEGQEFLAQMEEKHSDKRHGILVKCAAGISRSPTMLIYHLGISRRMDFYEALNYVREKEQYQVDFGSSPNYLFMETLKKKLK